MLRALVDSDDPKPITVEKNPISSDLRSHIFFLDDRSAFFQVQSPDSQDRTTEFPITDCGGAKIRHHLETDEQLSKDLIGMMSRYATMQDLPQTRDFCCWPSYYSTFELEKEHTPAHGLQCQLATLAHYTNTPPETQIIKIEDCSQFEATATHPDAPQTSFMDDDVCSGDATSHIVHPAVNISSFMATGGPTLASVAESTPTTILSCSAPMTTPEECSRCSLQTEWTSIRENALSESPRPPYESSTSIVNNSFLSTTTSLPWLAFQFHQAADVPSQGTSHDHSTWDTHQLSNETQLYGDISSAFDQLAAVSNSSVDLPQFDNDSLDITQPLLFSSSTTKFDQPVVMSSGDGCAANEGWGESFPTVNFHQCDSSPCRPDDAWQPQSPGDINALFQGQLLGRPIAYPRETRNAFLVDCKLRGLSYKDIKRIGGFEEAESTLRGRFRMLTKSKEQRVRKPQWHERDIRLLCEAVVVCSETRKQAKGHYAFCRPQRANRSPKVSWKKVAQYIWANGGSYHFGNATCKKKWCEVSGMNF
ncbi:hypothetical protein BO94DRAFT_526315 [Aspergillus sclerotioniger CBS 115572]|uniref:Myb-like domain-containing protein n=1 Tax=Aspergillus sclerotioniger CBS 115572 TaxID=1450535 RepID=A0A317V9H9_9EURO|nr:hypothetical protein BO94DRAFT_526315 [Aspergillus sclerotioniger CBS 115572]PWY71053.1 hypothetical protein BO94DRAFT_526315 [Aspergillus sclerotioniger CBS 115572]